MTARAGMAAIITRLRGMTSAGTADYSIAGTTYWTDDQLQERLDRQRREVRQLTLEAIPEYGATYRYVDYPTGLKNIEEDAAASGWRLYETTGGTVSASAYSVNYEAGMITFGNDTQNATYYLDARTYDINAAAAEIWETKAAHYAERVDWRADDHDVKASQYIAHCQKMAAQYRGRGQVRTVSLFRSDEA